MTDRKLLKVYRLIGGYTTYRLGFLLAIDDQFGDEIDDNTLLKLSNKLYDVYINAKHDIPYDKIAIYFYYLTHNGDSKIDLPTLLSTDVYTLENGVYATYEYV